MRALFNRPHQFAPRPRPRRQTTGMALGLVRLLLDAGRADEARMTLRDLQTGMCGPTEATDCNRAWKLRRGNPC